MLSIAQLQTTSFGYLTGNDLLNFCPGQLLIKQSEVYGNLQNACDDAYAELVASLTTRYNLTMELQKQGFTPAELQVVLNSGVVQSITIVNGGTGYQSVPSITISGGSGSGATAIATVTNGVITAIQVTAGGSGYNSAPTASVSGGGPTDASGAEATAVLSNGQITAVEITAGGSGYYNPPEINFIGGFYGAPQTFFTPEAFAIPFFFGGESQYFPFCSAVAVATVANGAVAGIQIVEGGSNYFTTPLILIAPKVPVEDTRDRLLLKICKILAVRNALGNMQNISEKMMTDFTWADATLKAIRNGQMALKMPLPNNPQKTASPVAIGYSSFLTLG